MNGDNVDVLIALDPLTGGAVITTDEGCEYLSAFPNTPIIDLSMLGSNPNGDWLQRQQYLNDLQQLEEEVREDK
ncbi:MAG: hypothetical protein ACJ72H_25445 [Candidatus Sulfotelmatobacter sp.]